MSCPSNYAVVLGAFFLLGAFFFVTGAFFFFLVAFFLVVLVLAGFATSVLAAGSVAAAPTIGQTIIDAPNKIAVIIERTLPFIFLTLLSSSKPPLERWVNFEMHFKDKSKNIQIRFYVILIFLHFLFVFFLSLILLAFLELPFFPALFL